MVADKNPTLSYFNKIWRRPESISQKKTEESIVLRILVQALVIVGIIATDVAAQTQMSLWAIPLSLVGSFYSWRQRKKNSVTLKFFLSIAMIGVLLAFFAHLIANLNDTRMVLAQLLVQVQVLHSFDLPRRKDLGYSMVIGLILLGVSGTVSQTLTFAPFLVVFLAIAIPTLVLDYRSRLGLESVDTYLFSPYKKNQPKRDGLKFSPLSPKRLGVFLLVVMGLGLTIFALMPRFPGYQLKTFPVSAPADIADRTFDSENREVTSPGYVKDGQKTGNGSGSSQAPTEGKGKVDETFYYGFNRKMNQNLRGELKEKVVLRIRSQAPGFWRALAFDRYTGQGWEISRDKQLSNIKRPNWSYRFYIPSPLRIGKTKKVIQSYTAVSDLPNIIPALSYPQFLYFPTKEVAVDPEGSLRSPAGLSEGLTYTVISEVPYRDRTLLGQASQEYPKTVKNYYLQVPPEISDRVRQQTEALLAKSPKPITSPYEKALFLAQTLKQNYSIKPDLPFFAENEDLVEAFLFRFQGGYSDHFSTALTIMLRSIGIPARVAVGFAPGQFNPFTGYYIVRNTDAYALTEVFFPGYGWFSFDPIPGHPLIPPSFQQDQTFGVLRQLWDWVASWLPSPVTSFFNILWTKVIGGVLGLIVWFWNFVSSGIIGVFTGLIVGTICGFLGWLGWKQWGSWSYRRRLAKLSPIERLYLQMLRVLGDKGFPKHPAQTPLEYAKNSRQHHQKVIAEVIEEISQAYVRWRYGSQMPNIQYLHQQYKGLIRGLKRSNS